MQVFGVKSFIVVALCTFVPTVAACQTGGVHTSTGQPLTSFADFLHSRGIALSEPSLLNALANSDPKVRSVAALTLAQDHDYDAVSSIKSALASESNPSTQIAMAEALRGLHDPQGIAFLQAMCNDRSLSLSNLVNVVQHLNMIGESSQLCADRILRDLASASNSSEAREIALPALPDMYQWVSPEQAGQIVTTLENMLGDRSPYVRMEAGHSLVRINSYSSASALRSAISKATDPVVRSSLQNDLNKLVKKD